MTAPRVSTALWFDTGAEEAARHYCALFPDASIDTVHLQQGAPERRAFIVEFTMQGRRYTAMNGGPHYQLSPAVSISALVDSQAEVDRLWQALLAGGGSESRCGWLTDRWGLSWQIIPRALPRLLQSGTSGRVMQAMMGMVKLDVAALEAAARG